MYIKRGVRELNSPFPSRRVAIGAARAKVVDGMNALVWHGTAELRPQRIELLQRGGLGNDVVYVGVAEVERITADVTPLLLRFPERPSKEHSVL